MIIKISDLEKINHRINWQRQGNKTILGYLYIYFNKYFDFSRPIYRVDDSKKGTYWMQNKINP